MKKLSIILILTLGVHLSSLAEKHFDLGFTTSISYTDYFTLALEPTIGYEFNDFFAMGTGIGMGYNSQADKSFGMVEPFLRFTPWHNDFIKDQASIIEAFKEAQTKIEELKASGK